jgi:endonuclease YncB( thermonuclease family)
MPLEGLQQGRVLDVIDGDTIGVTLPDGTHAEVRYFGVDTPERGTRCFREATDRNEALVGSTVLLLPDKRDKDAFGRLLRYVFTPDGVSIDATLVAEGFGNAWREDGAYRDVIIRLETEAQAAGRGCLWK